MLIPNVDISPPTSPGELMPQPGSARPQMFRLLFNVFKDTVPQDYICSGFDEWPAILERADDGLETEKGLRVVVAILQYLREKSPATVIHTTKILADGSRYGKLAIFFSKRVHKWEGPLTDRCLEPWRKSFGDENILDFYLDLLALDEINNAWASDALRLIGNSCADLGSYRDRTTSVTITYTASRHQSRTCTCQAEAPNLARSPEARRKGRSCHWCSM